KDTVLYRSDNVGLLHISCLHVRCAHAWYRHVPERFTTAVSGGSDPIMPGADAVVQVAGKDTVLHNVGFLSVCTLIVNIYRPAVKRDGSVIHHTDMFVAYLLVELFGENGNILPVK